MASYHLTQFRIESVLLCRDADNHQLEISRAAIDEGMCFVEPNRYGVTFVNRRSLVIDSNLTLSVKHGVDLFDAFVPMESIRRSGRDQKVVDVSPVSEEHIRVECAAIPDGAL